MSVTVMSNSRLEGQPCLTSLFNGIGSERVPFSSIVDCQLDMPVKRIFIHLSRGYGSFMCVRIWSKNAWDTLSKALV